MSDWLDNLQRIRAEHQQKATAQEKEAPPGAQIDQLLREAKAFEHLRDIRKVMLGGVGKIELFESASGYDVVLALMWEGPTADPRHPKAGVSNQYHILVGVHNQRLWVNGEAVAKNTPAALQAALLKAARNPGRRKELHKYGVGKG